MAKDAQPPQGAQPQKKENDADKKTPGRPQKPDDQKSEKTIRNKEAMS